MFWVDNLWTDERDGTLVANPSHSPEHGEYSLGCSTVQAMIAEIFDIVIKASEDLGKDTKEVADVHVVGKIDQEIYQCITNDIVTDEVIITVNPQLLAMMGLQDFLRIVGKIKKRINPKLEVAGILLTMCESRTTLCKVLTEEVTGSFQGKIKVFDTRIPATVKVGESIYYNMPIAQYSKKASAGIAYRKFAKEIIAYEG